jgi:hypothetical protein
MIQHQIRDVNTVGLWEFQCLRTESEIRSIIEHLFYLSISIISVKNTNTPLAWRPGVLEQKDDLSSVDKEKAMVPGQYAKCQARHTEFTYKAIFFLLLLVVKTYIGVQNE